jgi:hypothetical protein
MASASLGTAAAASPGALLAACVEGQGSAAHSWPASPELANPPEGSRNLADLLHFLCILHGRYPGVVDHAAARTAEPEARRWLAEAAYAFAGERAYLARLAVAAGPLPSTPGAADSDSAVQAQRHALEMLAGSERNGCALGAAMAVILDWSVIRRPLDTAARRLGIEVPAFAAADPARIAAVADGFAGSPPALRALLFGAQQILVQHYGLWELLESRARARVPA